MVDSVYYLPVRAAKLTIERCGARLMVCRICDRTRHSEHVKMLDSLGFESFLIGQTGVIHHRLLELQR